MIVVENSKPPTTSSSIEQQTNSKTSEGNIYAVKSSSGDSKTATAASIYAVKSSESEVVEKEEGDKDSEEGRIDLVDT